MKKKYFISAVLMLIASTVMPTQAWAEGTDAGITSVTYSDGEITDDDINIIRNTTWTDGYEFVTYVSPEEAMNNWHIEADGTNTLVFVGGTLHEGGSLLVLRRKGNMLFTDANTEYQLIPSGDRVFFDKENKMLIFRDAEFGSMHGLLKPIADASHLEKMVRTDLRRLVVAGTYTDNKGGEHVFSATENKASNIVEGIDTYDFAVTYDMPRPILLIGGLFLGVNTTEDGIELVPMRYYQDNDYYDPIPGSIILSLTRTSGTNDVRYPLLSTEYFTLPQLLTYAGTSNYTSVQYSWREQIQQQVDKLAVMRNEIFARHGYIFSSKKWKDYFGKMSWYKPTTTDVNANLTEIETINIELIRYLEKRLKEEIKKAL